MNFITFASPHLGSRGHKQVGYLLAYSKLYYWASPSTYQLTFSSSYSVFCILCVHIYIAVNSAFQLPFLCGLPFLEQRASETAHFIVGRTGKHLFLTDKDDGKLPLLLRMVDDCDDIKFRFDFFILSLCSKGTSFKFVVLSSFFLSGQLCAVLNDELLMPMQILIVSYQSPSVLPILFPTFIHSSPVYQCLTF